MRKSVETYKRMFVDPSRMKNGTPDMLDAKHIAWAALKKFTKLADAEKFIRGEAAKRTRMLRHRGWLVGFSMPFAEFSGFVDVDNSNFEHRVERFRSWRHDPATKTSGYTPYYPWHRYEWKNEWRWTALPMRDDVECGGEAEELVDFFLTDAGARKFFLFRKDYPCQEYSQATGLRLSEDEIAEKKKLRHTVWICYSRESGGVPNGGDALVREQNAYALGILTVWALFRMLDVQPFEPKLEKELYAEIPVSVDKFAEAARTEIEQAERKAEYFKEILGGFKRSLGMRLLDSVERLKKH